MTINVTHQEGMDEILDRYEQYLRASRDKVAFDLKKTPATAVLAPYFEEGEMLRALLVFVAASATGHEPRNMTMVAAAIELLHGASLIHDDIADETDERRGLPALHRQVGIGPTIALGDYLIPRAFAALRELESSCEPCNVLAGLHKLNDYARACCLGEIRELLPSDQLDPEENYLASVRGKTASQFAAAATLPVDPTDSALKTLFVGVVDQSRHMVVLLSVSRYRQKAAAIEQEIDRLHTNQWAEMLMHENCLVDQRPAHAVVIRDRMTVPMWESEFPAPILFENFVVVQDEADMYMLEYASTPELYETYQPLFHRLVTSFGFTTIRSCRAYPM